MDDLDGFIFFSGGFDGGSSNGSSGGNNSNMGCIILILFLTAIGIFCNWPTIQERCFPNHEVTTDSIVENDSIVWEDNIELDVKNSDKQTEKEKKSHSKIHKPSERYYYYDDEYDEDGMYKDEDEDIKDKRQYDDYDDDEADDWE